MRTSIPLLSLLWLTAVAGSVPFREQTGAKNENPNLTSMEVSRDALRNFAQEESKLNEHVNMLADEEAHYSGFDLFEEFERIHNDYNRMEDESSEIREIANSSPDAEAGATGSEVTTDELETFLNVFRNRGPKAVAPAPEPQVVSTSHIPRVFNRPIMSVNPPKSLPFVDAPPTVLVPKDLYYQSAPQYLQRAMPWEPVLRAVITPPSDTILLPTRPLYPKEILSEYPRELLANRFAIDRSGLVVRVIASESSTRPFNRAKEIY